MDPQKEGQGEDWIPWVPQKNKVQNDRGYFGYHQ